MNPRLKIMFLINSLQPAGAETFLVNHVRHLDRSHYEPIVCYMKPGGELLKSLQSLGVEVICLNERRRPDVTTLIRLYRLLRARRIDILQTHVLYAGIVGRLVGWLARVPVIISTEQDVRMGVQASRPFIRFLNDVTLPFAGANVYITQAVANSFNRGSLLKILRPHRLEQVIPNGIETNRDEIQSALIRVAARSKLGLEAEHFVIGNVGRLDHQKGQTYLIEAFAEALSALPRARLVIVGWGNLEAELKAQASRLGVSDKVLILGKRTDVLEILPSFDVFAFPSVFEGQGIAILEAMAEGVPVVASRVGGIPELITNEKTGLLVEPKNVRELKEAILRIANDPTLAGKLVSAARDTIKRRYSIERSVEEYDRLYKHLVSFPARSARVGITRTT